MREQLITIARFSLLEAMRDRFLWMIVIGLLLALLLSLFLGELAITESVQMKTAMLAYSLRLFTVFTVSLFVINSMLREFNEKGFELILSRPITRTTYFLGKFSGYAMVALVVLVCVTACIMIFMPGMNAVYWSLSLYCELLIVVALSLLCLFTLNSVTLAFTVVAGFYLLARSMQTIQLIAEAPILDSNSLSHRFMETLIDALAYLLPDLYRFTQTDWLLYGLVNMSDLSRIGIQTLIYLLLLAAAALFDLYRKEL